MLWKKKVNTFILYSVNYIVDKLNDSHYGCLQPGEEDRREGKDSFRLVMYFKHKLTSLNNRWQRQKEACVPPKPSHSPSVRRRSTELLSRGSPPGVLDRKGNGGNSGQCS